MEEYVFRRSSSRNYREAVAGLAQAKYEASILVH